MLKYRVPENWYILLACTIERPGFMTFGDPSALIRAIKAATQNADYKAESVSI